MGLKKGFYSGFITLVLGFTNSANASNPLLVAKEFWTSPEIGFYLRKAVGTGTSASDQLTPLLYQLRAQGLPTQFLFEGLPELDLIVLGQAKNFDPKGGTPIATFETRYGVKKLTLPKHYRPESGETLDLNQMDPFMIGDLYHELVHLYVDAVVRPDITHPGNIVLDLLKSRLSQQFRQLDDSSLEDAADELLAHELGNVIAELLVTRRSFERRKARGEAITEEFLKKVSARLYAPLGKPTKCHTNHPNPEFDAYVMIPATIKRKMYRIFLENRVTGQFETDLAAEISGGSSGPESVALTNLPSKH